ncbi:MAG: imidazole glycerol phosphate synthase subunit HisH [Candidatus Omnitrophica bacterium]|nr:imidazole glycerol phosphate synthase subunit HisH [Candidatus Omnitrophota bacterium]
MGNLFSVQSALNYLGVSSQISSDVEVIKTASKLILPGVGSFYQAMENLRKSGLAKIITETVVQKKTPILGICLGMQLLALSSTENGFSEGFGFISSVIKRFELPPSSELKIPHVGFEYVDIVKNCKLMEGLGAGADFYFTHSYRMKFENQPFTVGTCLHGENFVAVFEDGYVCGTQFHPEKSQTNGLIILKNFIEKF